MHGFIVRDATGQAFRGGAGRRAVAKLLTRDEARRMGRADRTSRERTLQYGV
jgi:hypothetical protein